jgi:hypothetical protein
MLPKHYLPAIVLAFLFGATLWCAADLWLSLNPSLLWKPKQVALAEDLGVAIGDYPSRSHFPVGYFYRRLRPGTHISEVHAIIRGYDASYSCPYNREAYYYFSSEEKWALRFEIWYDDRLEVDEVRSEDEDSKTISINGCLPGLLSEVP